MEGGQERKQSEEYIRHKHGRAEFSQRLECMVELRNNKCIVYHKKGLEIEICSAKTDHLQYHGKFNERQMKESWEIEYDVKSGNMVAKGIWSKGKLIKEIRWFNGGVMTELKRNESDSLDSMKRIPIYVGGFRYDEEYAKFVKENDAIDNESKSFHILNCES